MRWGRGLDELDRRSVARPTPLGSTDGRRVLLATLQTGEHPLHLGYGEVVGSDLLVRRAQTLALSGNNSNSEPLGSSPAS